MSKAEKRKIEVSRSSSPGKEIENKGRAFVLFYATWCPFSQRFLPVFEEYARGNPQRCMSVIVDDRPDLCEEYSIEYYPTVLLFKKGKVYKRLDAEPEVGLTKKQLTEFTKNS
jgi:thiol-disulfide isomerase/thioredoxin